MKKILALIMSILLAFSVLSISVSAEDASENIVVTYGETNFIFANDTPVEIQERFIAHYFGEEDDGAEAYGLTCTLFGHKLETTTVATVTHKVRTTAPRCLKEYHQVETCTRCDYTYSTVIDSEYISCC